MADTRSPSSGESSHLRPYPEYKDSGVERLGEIPLHWDTRRLKNWVEINAHVLPETTDPEYEFDYVDIGSVGTGRLLTEPKRIAFASAPSRARRVVRSGDTIVSTVRTYLKAVWHADGPLPSLVASTGFAVLTPRSPTSRRFVGYVCRSGSFTERITSESSGVSYPAIAETKFGLLEILVPPPSEQKAIANFLDCEIATIDGLVARQEQLIELLREKRAALITHAVTRGLDPNVPMKDSGVEWLGEIPAHWEVVQLRRVAFDRCDGPFGSGLKSTHYSEEGVRVVRLQNIGHGEFEGADAAFIPQQHCSKLGDHSVIPGDLLIAGLGDTNHPSGRACVAPEDIGPAMVKADCFRFRLDQSQAQPQFLALQLSATASVAAGLTSTGATRLRTSLTSTAARAVAIPDLQEQARIVDYITRKIVSLDHAQEVAQRGIDFLTDYRIALISAAVSGKIDVRRPGVRTANNACHNKATS